MKKCILVMTLVLLAAVAGVAPTTVLASEKALEVAAVEMVHVNRATVEQLQALPGVGPALSERIVAYREEHGSFKTAEQLTAVKGVGDRKLEQFRAYLVVD